MSTVKRAAVVSSDAHACRQKLRITAGFHATVLHTCYVSRSQVRTTSNECKYKETAQPPREATGLASLCEDVSIHEQVTNT